LGLAITRRLVDLHGGKISVISSGQEGSGTTFYFTLPIQHETPQVHPMIEEKIPEEQLVLIISKEKSTDEFLTEHLSRQGFKVMNVEIGSDDHWLDSILTLPVGAIVLNCEPAAEWGLRLMNDLKICPETKDIHILFYNILPDQNSGTFLDVDYLTKPLNPEALIHLVNQRGLACSYPMAKPSTIMIVDDEQETLRLHAQLIRERLPNCRVMEADNGYKALNLMKQTCPDLLLLDLMMPELDGFGVLEAMQSHETLRTVPVVIMTGQVLTEEMLERMNRSVAAILGKGLFGIEETLTQIDTALAHSKRLGIEPQQIARRTMAFIHLHFSEPISRKDIAHHIGVDERYLTHCFKQEFGVTPMKYLNRYRIKVARQYLETENKKITEIALDVGFSSSAHFNRVFHHEMRMSPREYLSRK
jgi:AraC-like DNA-binding protein